MNPTQTERIQNALWGLFIGDALAMPAHWYYDLDNLKKDFSGGLSGYEDPPHPHPGSFMVGSPYRPDTQTATTLQRPFDILGKHARFYTTNYTGESIETQERDSSHGNAVAKEEERYHYHHGMKAGENTLGAELVEVLMDQVITSGGYEPKSFITAFIDRMTSPRKDPYTEIYLREWFENYTRGKNPEDCAQSQRAVWSIGAHGGMIRPMVLSLLAGSAYAGLGHAVSHQHLTHRSESVTSALGVVIPLLFDLLEGRDIRSAVEHYAKGVRAPQISGEALFATYKEHNGPGNIDDQVMWRLHNDLQEESFDPKQLMEETSGDDEVAPRILATACYPEHGVPLILYLLYKYQGDLKSCLLANANLGGDNVHRGMVLGLLCGAATKQIPQELITGLSSHRTLRTAIEAYGAIAVEDTGL